MRAVYTWLAGLAATTALVVFSYQWLDRPIALLVHSDLQRSGYGLWKLLTRIPNPLIPLALIAFVALGLRALIGRPLSDHQATAFVCSLSVIITEAIKNQLKFLFGRTWPETWMGNNPSFIRDGVYGFHFMHGGGWYNAFPSGHMATTCAVLTVLWLWYPRRRWLYAVVGFVVGAGLVGANYHFLGDVLAGAFVGISIGWMATAIWNLTARKTLP